MKRSNSLIAVASMLLSMAFITSGASLAKSIFAQLGVEATTAMRLGFAAMILLAVFRPWEHLPDKKKWKHLLLYGASMGGMNMLFYMSIARIPLGIALALEFIGPLAVALFSSRNRKDLLWVACALFGIILLLPFGEFSAHLDPLGIFLAVAAGVFWALYIIFGKRAGEGLHGGSTVAIGMSIAAIAVLPIALLTSSESVINSHTLTLALAVAVLSSAVPYSLEIVALKRLSAQSFSILTSLEPAVGALAGFIFLSEKLSLIHITAIFLVMVASAGSTLFSSNAEQRPPEPAN